MVNDRVGINTSFSLARPPGKAKGVCGGRTSDSGRIWRRGYIQRSAMRAMAFSACESPSWPAPLRLVTASMALQLPLLNVRPLAQQSAPPSAAPRTPASSCSGRSSRLPCPQRPLWPPDPCPRGCPRSCPHARAPGSTLRVHVAAVPDHHGGEQVPKAVERAAEPIHPAERQRLLALHSRCEDRISGGLSALMHGFDHGCSVQLQRIAMVR